MSNSYATNTTNGNIYVKSKDFHLYIDNHWLADNSTAIEDGILSASPYMKDEK